MEADGRGAQYRQDKGYWRLQRTLNSFRSAQTTFLIRKQYSKRYLEQLLPHATVIPAVNQIENHPALPQQEIVDLCKEKGIHIMAYSPLGSTGGPLFSAEPVVKISEKHGVKPATVLLSYHRTLSLKLSIFPMAVANQRYCSPSRKHCPGQVSHP